MKKLVERLLQEARERSFSDPYTSADLAERVQIAVATFRFFEVPEEELEQAFLDAEKALAGRRRLNLGDVIAAWLATMPESQTDDARLIG